MTTAATAHAEADVSKESGASTHKRKRHSSDERSVQFYPLDITYQIKDNKVSILLFGRVVDGKRICVIDDSFLPYCWAVAKKGSDVSQVMRTIGQLSLENEGVKIEVLETAVERKNYLGEEMDMIKVSFNIPAAIPGLKDRLCAVSGVEQLLEYDIPFTRRYLLDKGITPITLYDVSGEEIHERVKTDYALRMGSIQQVSEDALPNPRMLAFDIETYNPLGKNIIPEEHPILMISFYGMSDGKLFEKVITWKRFRTDKHYIEFVESEEELLKKFKMIIEEYGPDIITGYYSDGFDFPYIRTRAAKHKVQLDLGLDHSSLTISTGASPAAKITGVTHFDVHRFIKFIMGGSMETDSFSLNEVSKELLGEGKMDVEVEDLAKTWDDEPEKLESYCEYNLVDSRLAFQLCDKVLPNLFEMVKVIPLPMTEISRMRFSQLVEWYLLKQEQAYNVVSPNKPGHGDMSSRMARRFKGAFVLQPKPGFYHDIVVFDFRSLYPTIIAAHNISPESLNRECEESERDYAPVEGAKAWFCKSKRTFISRVIEELITRRQRIKALLKQKKDMMLEARSYSLKILANAFYGYLGFYASRWYSIECADAVTSWGRHYIHKVIDHARKEGFEVLYSDTDSVFLALGKRSKEDALKFAERVNLELPELMELDYEGYYKRGIFVSAKMTGEGAKKKYAMLAEDGNIKFRGFELVRRNWSEIAKEVQERVLEIILKESDADKAEEYVKGVIKQLRDKEIPLSKVIMTTQLQKDIEQYENVGPHVAVARRMQEKGIPVGANSVITFVITEGKGQIRDKAKLPSEVSEKEYDPDYYIENQVIPAVESILAVFGKNVAESFVKKDQSTLSSFFGGKKK
ncbi:MAG TPA: DNA-directed DNA polymerase [Candidatus Nanoarchaeia archaeon]|nr:DNA-directed DNA polymerase [Candidatus Nanoarchaeia archaeon]